MPFTPAALLSEINTDPLALGYAGKGPNDIATLLNALTGPGAASVFLPTIGIHEIIASIAAADFAALTALQIAKLQLLFTGTTTIDGTIANNRQIVIGIFSGASAGTINALTAAASRTGSRAEVLWGTGTVITPQQVAQSQGH